MLLFMFYVELWKVPPKWPIEDLDLMSFLSELLKNSFLKFKGSLD